MARRHQEELARAINYSQLAMPVEAVPDEREAGADDASADGGKQVAG